MFPIMDLTNLFLSERVPECIMRPKTNLSEQFLSERVSECIILPKIYLSKQFLSERVSKLIVFLNRSYLAVSFRTSFGMYFVSHNRCL